MLDVVTKKDEEAPFLPSSLSYLYEDFRKLSLKRGGTGFAMLPISYDSIFSYSKLTGCDYEPFELEILEALDIEFIKVHSKS